MYLGDSYLDSGGGLVAVRVGPDEWITNLQPNEVLDGDAAHRAVVSAWLADMPRVTEAAAYDPGFCQRLLAYLFGPGSDT